MAQEATPAILRQASEAKLGAGDIEETKGNNVQAVIRLRPAKRHETEYIECNERVGTMMKLYDLDYSEKFSAILGGKSSQAEAFRVCGLPLVDAALQGRNTCLFAYGQTGSGKTFSMYGAEGGKNPSKLDEQPTLRVVGDQ
eukprot:1101865-Prymnesium_polylepis.1